MNDHTHAAPAISVMEFKRLLKLLRKKQAELIALATSTDRRSRADIRKMRLLVEEIDDFICRAQLDYRPEGKQFRAQLATNDPVLSGQLTLQYNFALFFGAPSSIGIDTYSNNMR